MAQPPSSITRYPRAIGLNSRSLRAKPPDAIGLNGDLPDKGQSRGYQRLLGGTTGCPAKGQQMATPAANMRRCDRNVNNMMSRRPTSTRLAPSRRESAQGASYVDRKPFLRIGAALFESMPTPWDFVKKIAAPSLARYFYQPTGSEPNEYHKWYYNTQVFNKITWMGVNTQKSPSDMWNYQEILFELKPSLVIEFGTTLRWLRFIFCQCHEANRRTIQGAFRGCLPRTS